jgi:hypothetical protein
MLPDRNHNGAMDTTLVYSVLKALDSILNVELVTLVKVPPWIFFFSLNQHSSAGTVTAYGSLAKALGFDS